VIANAIIDQRRVEFVLLAETKAQAISVMLENPPANYVEMFAMNGDQFYSTPCFRLLLGAISSSFCCICQDSK